MEDTVPETAQELFEDGALFDVGPGVVKLPAALSPSRAGDFQQCPLLYRLRVLDKVPEPPNAAAAKGTLVHEIGRAHV